MKKKKIIGFITGMFAYVFMIIIFSGYMHLKSHPFINAMIVNEFVNKATNNSFIKDAAKFKYYEFNLNNDKAPKLVGPALNTGEYYLSYSEADEYNATFTPMEWIRAGGWMEDEPWGPACLCHFYDPVGIDGGKKNLTDRATYVETFLAPLIIYKSRDAKTWASLSSNRYNWPQAKESVVKALQQALPSERNRYMAIAYRSLGETLHLIADMGCPPHVRNDSHPPAAQISGINVFGDPDPYEDLAGTIDLTQFTGSSYPPNSTLKTEVGNTNIFETIFEKMAFFTNGRIPTNQTIATSKFKQVIRPDNPYMLPSISEAEYRSDQWAYVKNYDGKDIMMCKDKHPYTFLSGNYRGQPYIDKECVESQASLLIPNIVEAGANVIRLFIPALKVEITEAKTDSDGVVRGNITYTIPSADDEYSGLFDLNNIYTGPVSLFVNGTKINAQFDAKNGFFEAKNIASSVTLKKDDLIKAQIEFGGIVLNSDTKKVNDNQVNIIDLLHKCTTADVTLYGDHLAASGASYGLMMYMANNENLSTEIPLVWNGTTFTANGTFQDAIFQGAKSGSRTLQFTGTVSQDGKTMLSFSAQESASYAFYDLTTYTETEQLAGNNIPLDSYMQNPPYFANGVTYKFKGSGVQSKMTVISGSKVAKDKDGKVTGQSSYASTTWNSSEYEPYIELSFSDYWK
ncbi:MAG: hypothetical protein ABSB78_09115 [Bacteroidota bacterium]